MSSHTPSTVPVKDAAVLPAFAREASSTSSDPEAGIVKVEQPAEPALQDPFGDETGSGTKYKSLEWWQCGLLLVAETVSLGILSLPAVMATMGFVPGVLLIAGLGLIATYTGYVIGQFKQKYMHVHNFSDAGQMILGRFGRELAEVSQALLLIFIMAAHIVTFSIMMNVLTNHGTCTTIFLVAGTILSFIMTLPRTAKNMSKLSFFCKSTPLIN